MLVRSVLLCGVAVGMLSCSGAGQVIVADDFRDDLSKWKVELEKGGVVRASEGALDVDVPGGCTVWLKIPLEGPVLIEYEVTAISAGGANDRVSDLNCFCMATDARSPEDLFATKRSGKFSDYDQLKCYYVGLGGNENTTTRFRRYVGEKDNRPLLPQHDLREPRFLIKPNVAQRIRIIAKGNLIQFYRDEEKLFELNDPQPYMRGHFGFRTVANHMRVVGFRVQRLKSSE